MLLPGIACFCLAFHACFCLDICRGHKANRLYESMVDHSLNSRFLRSRVKSFMKSTRFEDRYLVFSLSAKSLMIL